MSSWIYLILTIISLWIWFQLLPFSWCKLKIKHDISFMGKSFISYYKRTSNDGKGRTNFERWRCSRLGVNVSWYVGGELVRKRDISFLGRGQNATRKKNLYIIVTLILLKSLLHETSSSYIVTIFTITRGNQNIIHFLSGSMIDLHITLRKDQDGRKQILGWENNFHILLNQ